MAGDLNRATIVGRLGKDPEVRRTGSGTPVVSLSIATSESWRDKSTGERKERTQWHNVVIWSEGLTKVAEQYLFKGSRVLIEGTLETREWEKDGVKRYSTEVVLRNFDAKLLLLSDRKDGSDRDDADGVRGGTLDRDRDRASSRNSGGGNTGRGGGGGGGRSSGRDMDDEIPF